MAVIACDGQRLERALPVARAALHVEQRMHRPGQRRVQRHGACRILLSRLHLALAARFEEQAAQAEQTGFGAFRHRLENALGGAIVAGELGGLRAQQFGQRLPRKRPARLDGVAGGLGLVTRADGENTAAERGQPAFAAPLLQMPAQTPGSGDEAADETENEQQQPGRDDDGDRGPEQRDLDLIAQPVDGDLARPVGEPGEADRDQPQDDEIDQRTDHQPPRFAWSSPPSAVSILVSACASAASAASLAFTSASQGAIAPAAAPFSVSASVMAPARS